MDDAATAIGILGAATTLYGFSIAFYVFARALEEQQDSRVWEASTDAQLRTTTELSKSDHQRIHERTLALNVFLVVASGVYAVSLLGALLYLFLPSLGAPLWIGAFAFAVLAVFVVGFFVYVASKDFSKTRDKIRSLENPVPWTKAEEDRMLAMDRAQRSIRDIADEVGHRAGDVRERLLKLREDSPK